MSMFSSELKEAGSASLTRLPSKALQPTTARIINSQPSTSPHPALGIDHGDARIGIAATDDFGILAHPVETIDVAKGDPVERIALLASMRKVQTLVVGLPVRMDGSEGTSAAKVRAFAEKIRERLPTIPLVFIDETLTTSTAAAKLREAGRNAKKQKSVIDQAAAVEILNTWMGE
ncbi:MAG: Holliday junction resolvase RuvX [Verrucomicrobiota bacterium]